jgi:hypothetical protein
MAVPSFSFRIRPRLISVLRRASDCSLFKSRLSSEGRIPGCALISERVFSRRPLGRLTFADLTDRVLCMIGFWLDAVLAARGLRFVTIGLLLDEGVASAAAPPFANGSTPVSRSSERLRRSANELIGDVVQIDSNDAGLRADGKYRVSGSLDERCAPSSGHRTQGIPRMRGDQKQLRGCDS